MVPGLNELQEKYEEQGLVVVGVTNESVGLVETSIENQSQTYPIALVRGGSADSAYGVKGFPTVVLVGPDGTVLTNKDRHPESAIVEALNSVVLIPLLEGKKYSSINKAIKKKDLGKAWKAASAMLAKNPEDAQLTGLLESLESSFESGFNGAVAKTEKGAFGAAAESLEKLADRYKGYTRAKEALQKAKAIKKNPDASDDLKAHAMLNKAKAEFKKGKKANRKKGKAICAKILKSYPNTPTAEKARAMQG